MKQKTQHMQPSRPSVRPSVLIHVVGTGFPRDRRAKPCKYMYAVPLLCMTMTMTGYGIAIHDSQRLLAPAAMMGRWDGWMDVLLWGGTATRLLMLE